MTPSDLPRLMVKRIKRIRIRNPFRHNRQLVGVTALSERVVLHTWFSVWGSYSVQMPRGKKIHPSFRTLTVEILAQ
jgi:hypothetical protein